MKKVAISYCDSYKENKVNEALSKLMSQLGYEIDDIVKPGMTVFIKPNWVA